jgi:asparagine synthase (glutamine-hydrolysing)
MRGNPDHVPPRLGVRGVRTAQQDVYDLLAQARSFVYSGGMWSRLAGHWAFDDLDITKDRFTRWDPLNQSLYLGYKVMLAGLLLMAKGDRVAMNSSVEARYPLLDDDVIAFCASIAPEYKLRGRTDKWLLRQVAARTLPPRIARRPKTMFRASRSRAFLDPARPQWVGQLLSPESLRATGWFDPDRVARELRGQIHFPRITPKRIIMDLSLTCVFATQLWHHIFLGGGLCELPAWSPAPLREPARPGVGLGPTVIQPSAAPDGKAPFRCHEAVVQAREA